MPASWSSPPAGCDLKDHIPELEGDAHRRRTGAARRAAAFTNDTGQVDEAAYANELLDRVASLGQVLSRSDTDRPSRGRAAVAGPRPDRSLGSGPYRVVDMQPGVVGRPRGRRSRAASGGGASRTSRSRSSRTPPSRRPGCCPGDVDWILRTDARAGGRDRRGDGGGRRGAARCPSQWTIVFNTRAGRRTRTLASGAPSLSASTGGPDGPGRRGRAIVATTPIAPDSWAMDRQAGTPPRRGGRQPDCSTRPAGSRCSDGIRERDGVRLSSVDRGTGQPGRACWRSSRRWRPRCAIAASSCPGRGSGRDGRLGARAAALAQ